MTEAAPEMRVWQPPGCGQAVEYAPAVLEGIRKAALEAYLSLPRGGVEIGGLLLGRRDRRAVRILAYQPLECEHAFGPSFVLSGRDHARLGALLRGAQGLAVVGWYHSRTRSDIDFSDEDRVLHSQYFPERWQIALVVRPNLLERSRAAFYGRGSDGTLRSEGYFELEPYNYRAAPAPTTEPTVDPEPEPLLQPPKLLLESGSNRRGWRGRLLLVLGGLLSAGAWTGWRAWQAQAPPAVSLAVFEQNGQLVVRWDPATAGRARLGRLEIADGSETTVATLDAGRLRQGALAYQRRTGRVDVRLVLESAGGQRTEESTTFLGRARQPTPEEQELRRRNEDLAREAEQIKLDMKNQAIRTRRLERRLEEVQNQLQRASDRPE